ncbi:MAG: hypothetical protein ACFFAO_15865, partial [Candidatus Hermodarchaeota archaeon]
MTQILIVTSTEDKASMNIRKNLLNSKNFIFKEVKHKWHDNPLYRFEKYILKEENDNLLNENQIYLGLTD